MDYEKCYLFYRRLLAIAIIASTLIIGALSVYGLAEIKRLQRLADAERAAALKAQDESMQYKVMADVAKSLAEKSQEVAAEALRDFREAERQRNDASANQPLQSSATGKE